VNRRRTILILLILLSVTLITLDTRGGGTGVGSTVRDFAHDVFAPIQDGVDSALSPIEDWWDGVTRAGDIKDENRRLRRALQEARGKVALGKVARRENRELKALAGLPYATDIPGVDAQVVLGSPGNFESTVVLNKGTDAGVVADRPVVSGRGLIGRIAQASKARSTVLLLTDRDSGVNVRDASTNALGVIKGRPDAAEQQLDFVDPNAEVNVGDLLVTAGSAEGPYPPDIPVARVTGVRNRPGELRPRITIHLLADASRTEYVRVLQWPPA
jgi:rod shape-determining protein MreC